MPSYYVLDTHDWLYARFAESDVPPGHVPAPSAADADIVVYLEPPWLTGHRYGRLYEALTPRKWRHLYVFSQADGALTWAPGVYASLPNAKASNPLFSGGFYVYHLHYGGAPLAGALDAHRDRDLAPDLLWSFIGSSATRPALREPILALGDDRSVARDSRRWHEEVRWRWHTSPSHRDEAEQIFASYAETMVRSKFVVCPRGVGSGSVRMFEALRMGRCPVILSDDWTPPPFIDWERCALRVREADVNRLPEILREREADWLALGTAARAAWERFYAPRNLLTTLIETCAALRSEEPSVSRRAAAAGRALATREALRRYKIAAARLAAGDG